jgi:hypothetical protein
MPLIVRVSDKKVNGHPLRVLNPVTGQPFKNDSDITLSDEDLRNPKIIRLLPREHGGRFGDLVPKPQKSTLAKKGDS